MPGSNARAAADAVPADRRKEIRVIVRVPGRFSLASKRDANGDRRQFACRAVNISSTHMALATPISAPIGERVIAYFMEFGKIHGSIIRMLHGGFVIRIAASNEEQSRLLRKLIWLDQKKNYDVPDMRAHKRIVPQNPLSTITFPDGSIMGCFVIDVSASGAAVSADIVPETGTVVTVGNVAGTVVRHFTEGFAVQFKQLQNPSVIEQLEIHKY